MSALRDFFILCSGSNQSLLNRTPTELNKYAGIGATIFFTGVFATLAGSYAIYTVFQSYVAAVFFGLVWGLMIFNLDRYIVSTMRKTGRVFKDSLMTLPRLALAILIALVIAKPLELKIFDTEIQAELVSMQQEKYKEQEDLLKLRYADDLTKAENDLLGLKKEIEQKETVLAELNLEAVKEADGTGGSMNKNLGPIYKAKKALADQAALELEQTKLSITPLIVSKQQEIQTLNQNKADDLASMNKVILNGFAARMDALSRLSQKSPIIAMASLFIMLLFIAIETTPIFAKLISSRGPYDHVLSKHEYAFEVNHDMINTLAKNKLDSKLLFDYKTRTYKTELAINAEKEIAEEALKERLADLKKSPILWQELLKSSKMMPDV